MSNLTAKNDNKYGINKVLRSWYTYYGQVFQQTREHIQNLEKQQGLDDTMRSTIWDQIILEKSKLEKLEKQEHQWTNQHSQASTH